ncbi:MAG: muraminidase [Deltaproteobacteria bacterium HGW-Deltaproteobacteria-8]|nr:MAG: muraminidase [Deltaproteobacteria bacterium HGW-Deltaproteobacteria-8]
MQRTNRQGLDLILVSEELRLEAYRCPAGVWTIGWGHTGPDVYPGMVITEALAILFKQADLERFESAVEDALEVPVTGNQFSALVSFAFNVGDEAFRGSTLLNKLNTGDINGAAAEFKRWVHSKGRLQPGLVTRRAAERELFLTPGDGDPA